MVYFVYVKEGLITLPRSKYMERYFGCSFFTTFFLREKKVAERKARIRGDCAAIRYAPIRRSSPSYVSPPMTAQPIARIFVCTRNGRRVRRLPFLKEKYYVCCFSFSRLQSAYTLCRSLSNILNLSCLAVWTSAFAINAKHVFFAVPCIIYCHRRYLVLSAAECAS